MKFAHAQVAVAAVDAKFVRFPLLSTNLRRSLLPEKVRSFKVARTTLSSAESSTSSVGRKNDVGRINSIHFESYS